MVKFKISDTTFDKIYPIGAIYMSVNSTNPSELFGGEWERIKDTFLLASGDTYDSGSTGGSADSVVVSHNHTQHSHTHSPTGSRRYIAVSGDDNWAYASARQQASSGTAQYPYSNKNTNGITEQNETTSAQPSINNTGVSGTGKNMPPYLAVYCWVRIA